MTGYSMGAAARVGRKEGIVIQTIRRLRTNSTAMFGLIVLALLILLSVFAPVIAPYHYTEMDMLQLNAAPSLKHFFGTDSLGRDILSRLIYGGRYSIFLGISSSVLSMAAAIVLGVGFLLIGELVFLKLQKGFAEEL